MKSTYLTSKLVLLTVLLTPLSALAVPITFDLAWSGDSFGNTAVASGSITMDDAILLNPGNNDLFSMPGYITDFSIIISGASSGNGSWTLADFGDIIWQTDTALNLTQELIGQPTSIDPWGTSLPGNTGGDFNLFGGITGAPQGTYYFQLTTNNGSGDNMLMTSFAPATTAVAEPGTLALLGLGIAGLGMMRRKK